VKDVGSLVKKAVFPVAGYGTRFLPSTKAYPKEMLPILDKPLIQYAAEEAIAAGCTELIFVTSHTKKAIEDHFDRNIALEQHLLQKQEFALVDLVNRIIPSHVTCIYIRQAYSLGLGHAVACAANLINGEPFAVILADDLIKSKSSNCLQQLITKYDQTGTSIIAVEEVAGTEVSNYGIVGFNEPHTTSGFINRIIEKPEPLLAPSKQAVVGRYILTPKIIECLKIIEAQSNSIEVQLTDALAALLSHEPIYALEFEGARFDCGKKTEYFRAILEHALQKPEYRQVFNEVAKKLACVL